MIASEARISEILEAASIKLFAGQVTDTEALSLAYDLGYIRNVYEGVAGFLSLAKLELTPQGEAAREQLT